LGHNETPASFKQVHEAVLVGSLGLIAQHDEKGKYIGPRNLRLGIFPGSGLAKRSPKWIVAVEVVETQRVFARCVAAVESRWIEAQAQHLVKKSFSDPVWSLKRGEVVAYESVSLYGLTLAERRPMSYHEVDPSFCRDLLIREGLVHGAVNNPPEFLRHNLQLIASIQDSEAKGRRRDLLISDDDVYQLYAKYVTESVCRVGDLGRWWKRLDSSVQKELFFTQEQLLRTESTRLSDNDFPNALKLGGVDLALNYSFAPGEATDGITMTIPVGVLHGVGAEPLQWSVPGMFPAVVEQWLRTLPKNKRKLLAPLPDKLEEIVARLLADNIYRQGRFLSALGSVLQDLYRISVDAADWDALRIPTHLQINTRVVDEQGRILAAGRDLNQIKAQLSNVETAASTQVFEVYERKNLQQFPDAEILQHVVVEEGMAPVMAYPGLVDADDGVQLKLFETAQLRDQANRLGYSKLALLQVGKPANFFRRELAKEKQLGLYFAGIGSAEILREQLMLNVAWYCYFEGRELPASADEFAQRLDAHRGDLNDIFRDTVRYLTDALQQRFSIVNKLDGFASSAYADSVDDIRKHIQRIVPGNVLQITPQRFLPLLPRFLQGVVTRLENLQGHVPRDRALIQQLQPLESRLAAIGGNELHDPGHLLELKFYVEELRLKFFAEPVSRQKISAHPLPPTQWKVSEKRVEAKLLLEERRVGLA
jgi:ATP-dependent helicase HrpA